jgi:hypothetical protein
MLSTSYAAHAVPAGKLAFDQLVAHLRSAARYPLRVACIGTATFVDDDPTADPISFDRTIHLAECSSLSEAISEAETRIALDDISFGSRAVIRYAPRVITIVDRDGCLVAAGEVRSGAIGWCEPVRSDGEARKVVTEASRLRGRAMVEASARNHEVARRLRFSASALEGRLVDSFWRETAHTALRQAA